MYKSTMVSTQAPAVPKVSTVGETTITREQDGSITLDRGGPQPIIPKEGDHQENLAQLLDRNERIKLADKLIEYMQTDKDSRGDWERRASESRRMLGLSHMPGAKAADNTVPDSHEVTHPALATATYRFGSEAIIEVFPPTGPAKTAILGRRTPEKVAQAKRMEDFNNYYLTTMDRGYYHDTDQMLHYLPQGGSAFRKGSQDWVTGLPKLRYVKAESFICPYMGTDLESMPRYCHETGLSGQDIRRAQLLGMFMDTSDVPLTPPTAGEVLHETAADQADARAPILHIDDEYYPILEYHVDLELHQDPENQLLDEKGVAVRNRRTGEISTDTLPYIVVVETSNREVLMIRRNWREKDPRRKKRLWFAHHRFLPGLGFLGFGYPHLIGSMGDSASGVVNAILDAAYACTKQGGFKTKEGRAVAGEMRVEHGVYKDVDASYDDLAKAFYSPDFKPPQTVMFHLLEHLVAAGDRFAGTVDVAVGDASNLGPVGTTLALIEQSKKPQVAIHKRLHMSFNEELDMFNALVEDCMPNDYVYDVGGEEQHLLKSDYDGRVDVVSVTDPNIYSDQQRIMRGQAVMEMQKENPDLYSPQKRAAAQIRLLEALRIDAIEEIGPEAESPKYLDPVSENGLITVGKGVMAFEPQDHAAHITIHQNGAQHALSGIQDPQENQQIQAAFSSHIRQHMAFAYRQVVFQKAGIQPPPVGPDNQPQELDPEMERQISQAVLQALPPPPPPDQLKGEGQQVLDASQAKIQAAKQESDAKIQRETQEAEVGQQRAAEDHAAELQRQDEAHAAEQRRLNEAAQAEEIRKDAAAAGEMHRIAKKAAVDIEATQGKHEVVIGAARRTAEVKLDSAQQLAEHKVDSTKDLTSAKLEGTKKATEAKVDATKVTTAAKVDSQRATTEAKVDSQRRTTDQKVKDTARTGEQKRRHADKDHEQSLRQGDESARQELETAAKETELALAAQKAKDEQALKSSINQAEHSLESAKASSDQKLGSAKKMDAHKLSATRKSAADKRRLEKKAPKKT